MPAAQEFPGAEVVFGNVTDVEDIKRTAFGRPVDVVVSCLASRTGGKVRYPGSQTDCVKSSTAAASLWACRSNVLHTSGCTSSCGSHLPC